MSVRSFRSISMVAGVAGAALACYMVSLRVASERATLEKVETSIVLAQRDIRLLQTEIGTRGRLAQLEKWNTKVLALSAPDENQFLQGSFQLATLARPRDKVVDPGAPIVLAAAPAPQRATPGNQSDSADARPGAAPSDMMHVASFKTDAEADEAASRVAPAPKKTVEKPAVKPAEAAQVVAQAKATTTPAKVKPVATITPVANSGAAKSAASVKVTAKAPAKVVAVAAKSIAATKDAKAKK